MYAIIECGGKQYRVSEGDVVRVEKLDAAVGSTIDIDKVLMLSGEKVFVGSPLVEDALVSCRVLNHDKDKKVIVYHYKAKKNIRKRYGHRQPFTSLLVESIHYGKGPKPEKKAVPKPVESEMAVTIETKEVVAEKPVKKATVKKTETDVEKPVKKTAASAKKTETAATAEEKPVKKTATRAKKTETEG